MAPLSVGGIVPFSTVDCPGRLAAVVFCRGCGWHCPYCHNTHLQGAGAAIAWRNILATLERRRGLLEAVVFSGGEPLLQGALAEAARQVRELGFGAALHTSGARPANLRAVLPQLSWVGFDFKAPFDRYAAITRVEGSGAAARESLALLLESGVPLEVRTTVAPGRLTSEDLLEMAECLGALGVTTWVLQEFHPEGCRDPDLLAAVRNFPSLASLATALPRAAALPDLELRLASPWALAV